MLVRSLFAFLVMPGVVAIAIPAVWAWQVSRWSVAQPLGLLALGSGFVALLWCVRDFYVIGKGTLAPWTPPRRLITVGLYRYTRNPMYLAVILMLLGWAAAFVSTSLLLYAVAIAFVFHLRVRLGEEPWLAREYGDVWIFYARRVPRWLW